MWSFQTLKHVVQLATGVRARVTGEM